jgi:hypothetical protein
MIVSTTNQPSSILTMSQALDFAFNKKFMDFYCLTIAKVVTVNNQDTLTVQSLINYKLADDTGLAPPKLFDVPRGIIMGGDAGIIIEYAVGDVVLVGFIDRQIDALKQTNPTNITPQLNRLHDVADAFVIMNWSYGKLPSVFVKVTNSGIELNSNGQPLNINSAGGNVTVNAGNGDVNVNSNNATVTATNQANISSNQVVLGGTTVVPSNAILYGTPAAGQSNSTKVFVGG